MAKTNRPKPVSASLYDSRYYVQDNHGYEEFKKNKAMPELILDGLKNVRMKGKTILDLGCGRGEFLLFAAQKGATVYGIDYSDEAVKLSEDTIKVLKPAAKKFVQVRKMDAKHLDFPNEMFDLVVGLDVIEHLHEWELELALKEITRVLKANGKLIMHTSPNKIYMQVVRKAVNIFGLKLRSDRFHVNEISYFSAKKYFKAFAPLVVLKKDRKYWSNQMAFRGKFLKLLALLIDLFLDFWPVHLVFNMFPLNVFWSTASSLMARRA